MSFLSFFKRARGARPNGSKSVKDFLKMAEVQRHAHFAEGCDELDRRTDGREPSMDLDRHVAFAQIAKQRTADFEKSGKQHDLLVSELCFTWCACLVPEDTLEELNDAVRLSNDANHGAHFAMAMSRARDQLGEQYFKPIQHDEAAIRRRAKKLLRKRWAQEATIFESYSDTCTADDLIQWINNLDAGTLHEYAIHFNWDTNDKTSLEAILKHPDCDKATAITIYGLASPDFFERPDFDLDDPIDKKMFLEIEKVFTIILDRFSTGGFSTAHFTPSEDVARLKRDRDIAKENGSIKWYLPEDAFVGFEGQPHQPKYEFDHDSGKFRTPFDEWVKIAAMK